MSCDPSMLLRLLDPRRCFYSGLATEERPYRGKDVFTERSPLAWALGDSDSDEEIIYEEMVGQSSNTVEDKNKPNGTEPKADTKVLADYIMTPEEPELGDLEPEEPELGDLEPEEPELGDLEPEELEAAEENGPRPHLFSMFSVTGSEYADNM